ncbi:MAG: hypothetical protein L6R40_006668 [Gallowayella cf. fulva]|nr:MAG: hypothetical protein L6R40_006668 [Xanthomendoza cf. fulva]
MCIATSKTEVVHREAMNALGRPGFNPTSALQVTDIRFDRTNDEGVISGSLLCKELRQGSRFNWITRWATGSMSFYITCFSRIKTRCFVGTSHEIYLSIPTRQGYACRSPILIGPRVPDNCSYSIVVLNSVVQSFQYKARGSFSTSKPISSLVVGVTSAIRRKKPSK